MVHGLSCSMACGIFPDQGLNRVPCISRRILNHCATKEVPNCLFVSTWTYGYLFELSIIIQMLSFFFFFFGPRHVPCGILVPQPGIEPGPSAVKVQSPNHWAAREVLSNAILLTFLLRLFQLWPLGALLVGSCVPLTYPYCFVFLSTFLLLTLQNAQGSSCIFRLPALASCLK